MAINSKKTLSNKYFSQSSGETLTLSGNTIIDGTLNFASGYTPTDNTSVVTKQYTDAIGVDSLTFQNGITRSGDNVELGGGLIKNTTINSVGRLNLEGNIRLKPISTIFNELNINKTEPSDNIQTILSFNVHIYNNNQYYITTLFKNNLGSISLINENTLNEDYFTSTTLPDGWTGDTFNNRLPRKIGGVGRYLLIDLLVLSTNLSDALILNLETKESILLSNIIPQINNLDGSLISSIQPFLSIKPIVNSQNNYQILFHDITTNILYLYNKSTEITKIIQEGDTVSGDTTMLPTIKNAQLIYGNTLFNDKLVIETNNNDLNNRYIIYDIDNDSVIYNGVKDGIDLISNLNNITTNDIIDYKVNLGVFDEPIITIITNNQYYRIVSTSNFGNSSVSDFNFEINNNVGIIMSTNLYTEDIIENIIYNIKSTEDDWYELNMDQGSFSVNNPTIETKKFYNNLNQSSRLLSSYIIVENYFNFRNNNLISVGTYNNEEINIGATNQGFQYPSNYTPTEQTSLLTLGNRNETSNKIVTGATTLTNSDHTVFVNGSGSTLTVTLVAEPKDGLVYTIKDATGNASTNPITIDGNGNTIDGQATITINIDYYGYEVTYSATLDAWLITNTINY